VIGDHAHTHTHTQSVWTVKQYKLQAPQIFFLSTFIFGHTHSHTHKYTLHRSGSQARSNSIHPSILLNYNSLRLASDTHTHTMPPTKKTVQVQHQAHPFFDPKSSNRSFPSAARPSVGNRSSPLPQSSPLISVPLTESQNAQSKSSFIWDHGCIIPGGWQCIYCSQKYSNRGTSNQMTHLCTKHQIACPGTLNINLQQNLLAPRQINQNRLREMIAE
jgi:hypothetical protein